MRSCLCFFLLTFVLSPVFAQRDGTSDAVSSGQLWNELNLTHAYSKFVFQGDLLLNNSNDSTGRARISKHIVNWGLRGWAQYYITPRIKLGAILYYQYNTTVPEVSQQQSSEYHQSFFAQHFVLRKRITIYNRLRFDNKFAENVSTHSYDYSARLRYMPKVVLSLNSAVIRKKSVYFLASDEVFMPFGKGPAFNMNLFTTGFGYCFTSDIIFELTYTNQYKKRTNLPSEVTNALGLTLSVNNFLTLLRK